MRGSWWPSVKRSLDRTVGDVVPRWFDREMKDGGKVANIIDDVLGVNLPDDATMTQTQFTFAMVQTLVKAGVGVAGARRMAVETLGDMLKDCQIKFGDSDYAWDREGARTVCQEYQFQYWEQSHER